MPRLKPCINCGALSPRSRCPAHDTSGWNARRPTTGYGSGWNTLRKQVLAEEPRCRSCGQPSTQVDHIRNKARGGTDDRANLQGICAYCHRKKTAREGVAGHA